MLLKVCVSQSSEQTTLLNTIPLDEPAQSVFANSCLFLSLSIADNVPSGSEARISGTNVTLVRLEGILLVKHLPCFAFLPGFQPSFCKSLISCDPVMAGRSDPINR